jgi:Flp pilus assembly protein TadG
MRRSGRSGNMVLEMALWMPILLLLIVGMIQIGKITYLYYSLQKVVYSAARALATQQNVNFCDLADDPVSQAVFAASVNDPNTGVALINNLTPAMLQVSTTCRDATGATVACDTSGCATPLAAAQQPSYITVSIPAGYQVQPRIPYILLDPILLYPSATVPFSGSSL